MADPIDVALTIGGWIVASIVTAVVTLWGVRYAHRKEVESQRAHDDVIGIYGPIRNEMERILADQPQIGKGRSMWVRSGEFDDILRRGLLRPPRHDGLRTEVDSIVKLHGEHLSLQSAYYKSVTEALEAVFKSTNVWAVGGEMRPLRSVIGLDFQDDRFRLAIAGSVDEWLDMFKGLQASADAMNAHVAWETMIPKAAGIFAEIERLTSDAYRAYQDSANALLEQAKKIRGILDRAISETG